MQYRDRVALVTGAAGSGMGRSIALTLAREGASVVVNYRSSAESAAAIVEHIDRRGGRAIAVQADVTQRDQCEALVDAAITAYDRVDICIIGPGGGWHPEPPDRLDSAAALDDAFRELSPLYYLMPLVLPGMYEREWGRLIGIAQHPDKRSPAYAYNAGKAARSRALLLAGDAAWSHGVTINVICPGPVSPVSSLDAAIELCDHGEVWRARANVTPQDIAEGVALICSEAGRYITGNQLLYGFY